MAYFLNNVLRHSIATCNRDSTPRSVAADFRSNKRIVEDANRNGCNPHMPDVYTLIQEVETRFGTHYLVAERFLKSSSHMRSALATRNRH